jgi:hypothetical protein
MALCSAEFLAFYVLIETWSLMNLTRVSAQHQNYMQVI